MIDLVLLAIIGVSALLGLMRGLVGIVVSTAAWVLAALASFQFGATAGLWLASDGRPDASEMFGGYALVFLGVLVSVGLCGALLRSLVRASALSGADRAFGFGIGLLRGMLVACLLVLLMGFTPLPREPAWQQSQVLPVLLPVATWMRARLPDWSVPDMDLRIPVPAGDNASGQGNPSPLIEGALQQVMQSARQLPGRGAAVEGPQPVNLEAQAGDPADIQSAGPDPANIESTGPRGSGRQRPSSNQ